MNTSNNRLQEQGFMIEESSASIGQVDFLVISCSGRVMKIKVRSISQRGSYIFVKKKKFNIKDPDLYMTVLYIPHDKDERIIYLIPATDWGIKFSDKARDVMEPCLFSKMI